MSRSTTRIIAAVDGGATTSAPACRTCGKGRVVPVVYGVPNAVLAPLFMSGQIEAGGAMDRLADHSGAHWACRGCGSKWRGGMFGTGSGDSPADPVVISDIVYTGTLEQRPAAAAGAG